MKVCGRPGPRIREEDIECNIEAVLYPDGSIVIPMTCDFSDPALNEVYLAGSQIGPYVWGNVVTIAADGQR